MSEDDRSCPHCGSAHLRRYRSVEETLKSFVRVDLGFWDNMVRRTVNSARGIGTLPLICESCQRYSMPCPRCQTIWKLEALPRSWAVLKCPDCGESVTYALVWA